MIPIILRNAALIVLLGLPALSPGQLWTEQTSGTTANLRAVQFSNAVYGYACGDSGTVLRTADGGATWFPVNIATAVPVNDLYFINVNEGWAVAGDENNAASTGQIWYTANGGINWTQQTPSTTEARFGITCAGPATAWAVGSRNGPINIDATVNGGTTWINQSNSNIFGWLYKIDAISPSTALAIGGAFFPSVTGFIIKTSNGGATWSQLNTGTIPFMKGIDMFDAGTGFVVGDAGAIMTTVNGGAAWTTQTPATSDTLQGVSFISPSHGWICGHNGNIQRTVDGGSSWSLENSGVSQNLNGIFALDSNTVWAAGNNGKILKRSQGTGIQPSGPALHHTVYPNPFTTHSIISTGNSSGNDSFTLVIHDILGNEIRRESNLPSGTFTLYRGDMPRGFYLYTLSSHNGQGEVFGKLIAE